MRKIAAVIALLCAVIALTLGGQAGYGVVHAQGSDTTYVVQPGDNLYRIGLKFGVSAYDIARANGIVNPNIIYVGQQLIIPGIAAPTLVPTPTALFNWTIGMGQYSAITTVAVGAIPANTLVRISSAQFTGEWIYTVVTADDIVAQAKQSELAVAPGVTPGAPTPTTSPVPPTATSDATQVPTVVVTSAPPTATSTPGPIPEFYTVQAGDNLYRISIRFNVLMQYLIQLNGLTNPNLIYVGQTLRLRPPDPLPVTVPTTAPATAAPSETPTPLPTDTPTEVPTDVPTDVPPTPTAEGESAAAPEEPTATLSIPTMEPGTPTTEVLVTEEAAPIAQATEVPPGEATAIEPTSTLVVPTAPAEPTSDFALTPQIQPPVEETATVAPTPTPLPASNVGFALGMDIELLGVDPVGIVARLSDLNVNWVKQRVYWKNFETEKGSIDFSALDPQIEALVAGGFKVMLTVSRAPEWARGTNVEDGPAADNADFAAFVAALAERYKGKVQAYEVWERPNVRREWNGKPISAAGYVELLRVAYETIKGIDPEAVVVSAGLAPTGFDDGINAINDRTFLRQAYNAGIASYADAVGVQPNGWANPPDTTCCEAAPGVSGWFNDRSFYFRDTLNDYRQIMLENNDGGTFMWATDFGWGSSDGITTDPSSVNTLWGFVEFTSQQEQAQYTVRALEIGAALGYVGPMFVNNLNACQTVAADAASSEYVACYYSLLDPQGGARPVYDAIKGR